MPNREVVQFRAGQLLPSLVERADEPSDAAISRVADRDLGRYYILLSLALSQVDLSVGEASLIMDAMNGTAIDLTAAQMIHYEIEDSLEDGLAAKWEVDGPALVRKLAGYSLLQKMAIADAVERFWNDAYHVDHMHARMERVGLIKPQV